jgi:hypothetical protein
MLHRLFLGLVLLGLCSSLCGCGPAIEDQINTSKRAKPDYKPGQGKGDAGKY